VRDDKEGAGDVEKVADGGGGGEEVPDEAGDVDILAVVTTASQRVSLSVFPKSKNIVTLILYTLSDVETAELRSPSHLHLHLHLPRMWQRVSMENPMVETHLRPQAKR
jgi:hypothetical protein